MLGETMIESKARFIAPTLFLAGLLALAYQVLDHFITPVVWAVIMVYISWPLHRLMQRLCGGRATLAALGSSLILGALLAIPLIVGSFYLQAELVEIYRNLPVWLEKKPTLPTFATHIPYLGQELQNLFGQADTLQELLKQRVLPLLRQYSGNLLDVVGDLGYSAAKLFFALLTAFFFYRDGPDVTRQVRKVLRMLIGDQLDAYVTTSEETVKAVVYGIVLTAIAQGTLAGLGYWTVGLGTPILLAVVTMFFSMIPFGTPLVWGSASIWLLANGQQWEGVALALWGGLVVSWIDNVVRPLVISGATRIPFLLVFFGVLGGLARFGLVGLFLGPVVLAISLAVWREWLGRQAATEKPAE
jgi:predicted PurR-regulated permease PerM